MESENSLNLAIIALNRLNSFGKKKIRLLLNTLEGKKDLDFLQILRQGIKIGIFQKKQAIGQFLDAEEYAHNVIDLCEKEGIGIVNAYSNDFPAALRFENGPILIYYRGKLDCLNANKRATVVGTRHPNENGRVFAYNVAELLAQNGFTVLSGLAQGCDTQAHRAALDNDARTVAFVPSNLTQIAPASNSALAEEIIEKGGLVLSVYSPMSTPNSNMYITRDRLQAGAADIVFASEFDSQSGTLQTLEFASKFSKPVYTLKKLVDDPEFNGYQSLIDHNISCNVVDWETIKKVITEYNTEV